MVVLMGGRVSLAFNPLYAGYLFKRLLSSADFFKIRFFKKKYFMHTIRVSNRLDQDQDRRSVGPDLGPNCLQR